MTDPQSTVGGEGRPAKLPKIEDNGNDSTMKLTSFQFFLIKFHMF